MLTYARSVGVDVDAIMASIDLTPAMLDEFDRRIPEASRLRAWVAASEQARDPAFGLRVARHVGIGVYDALDYALYFSDTLGQAICRLLRFYRVICDAWASEMTTDGGTARLRRLEKTHTAEADCVFASLLLRARALTGVEVVPREVRFEHAAPADPAPYRSLFGGPVRFGCHTTEIRFASRDLELPIATAHPGIERVLERYLSELVKRLPQTDSFAERVRAIVVRTLADGEATLASTARSLRASPRTVQRRLQAHGTTYAQVVDGARRDLAERLMDGRKLSTTEIAFLLGFGDVSGFRRARRRWSGVAHAPRRDSPVARS
jgi:AraC-like DNA-binding protein